MKVSDLLEENVIDVKKLFTDKRYNSMSSRLNTVDRSMPEKFQHQLKVERQVHKKIDDILTMYDRTQYKNIDLQKYFEEPFKEIIFHTTLLYKTYEDEDERALGEQMIEEHGERMKKDVVNMMKEMKKLYKFVEIQNPPARDIIDREIEKQEFKLRRMSEILEKAMKS